MKKILAAVAAAIIVIAISGSTKNSNIKRVLYCERNHLIYNPPIKLDVYGYP
jgi:hypothetical protein